MNKVDEKKFMEEHNHKVVADWSPGRAVVPVIEKVVEKFIKCETKKCILRNHHTGHCTNSMSD